MKITRAELKAVAVSKEQYPADDRKEIALAGRSNVGKSSLINLLCNRKKLARTSNTPGKTRTLNFYDINDAFRIVDLPGYGYAKVSKEASQAWGPMIESYLQERKNLAGVVLLVDIRHPPTALDRQMYDWLRHFGYGGFVIATKADKLSKSRIKPSLDVIRRELGARAEEPILPVSIMDKKSALPIWEAMDTLLFQR